jgi:multimeric flavodoxin WrbA
MSKNQKNVMIVVGSPRKRGNSAILAKQVASGAKDAGAEVELFFLHGMTIKPCSACEGCRKKRGSGCVIRDDMRTLYPKMRAADAIIIASPIYWFTVSAQTKLFMDRWYAFGGDENYKALAGKKFGVVLAYADADPFISGAVNALRTFQDAFKYLGAEVVGTVYGSAWKAGEISRNKAVMKQAYALGEKIAA